VSEEEIDSLAQAHFHGAGHKDPGECNGFKVGFRKAMELRATMELEKLWPTFEDAQKVILPTHGPFFEGYMACRLWILDWIKERLMK